MSDTTPLTPVPPLVDPTATQVLTRTIDGSDDFLSLGAEATSCSIIVVDGDWISGMATGPNDPEPRQQTPESCEIERPVIAQITDERSSTFEKVRPEVLVVTGRQRYASRAPGAPRGRRSYRLRLLESSDDSYCSALIDGVENSSNEFVVIPRHGDDPLTGLPAALGHMWLEGADMALLPGRSSCAPTAAADEDPIASLPRFMGLERCCGTPMTIVMRRWFAKWIFNEIDRLPNPVEELVDRIRLLGSTIVFMEWDNIGPERG